MQSVAHEPFGGREGDAISDGGSWAWTNRSLASLVASPPRPSVTVRRSTYRPGIEYAWLTTAPIAVELSPKFQVYRRESPSASVGCAAKVRVWPGVVTFELTVGWSFLGGW